MAEIKVRTQAQFEAALKMPDSIIDILEGVYELVTNGLEAPFIRLWGKAELRVVAWESSQPRVVASGYVQLSLLGKVVAKVSAKVSVLMQGKEPQTTGGKQTRHNLSTPKHWCDYYGVPVKNGVAILYKALDKDFRSGRGLEYKPGTLVKSDGWNNEECDSGLHFIPAAFIGYEFMSSAEHVVACEVKVKDMLVFPMGSYPNKAKAPSCKVLYECDENGEEVK